MVICAYTTLYRFKYFISFPKPVKILRHEVQKKNNFDLPLFGFNPSKIRMWQNE